MKLPERREFISAQPGADVHIFDADREAAIEALRARVYSRTDTWVQELLSNARDGIRQRFGSAADSKGLVTVTWDLDAGKVCIQDNGAGMSRTILESVYRVLGSSTRRDSNDFTGSFGIGSKSPLKVADSFLLTSRSQEDGKTYDVVVGRFLHEGRPHWGFRITGERPLDGEPGVAVTVTLGPELMTACRKHAQEVLQFWNTPHKVLVRQDGRTDHVQIPNYWVTHNVHQQFDTDLATVSFVELRDKEPGFNALILVDDIPYPYAPPGEHLVQEYRHLHSFSTQLHHAKIIRPVLRLKRPDLVELTSGREFLNYTPETIQSFRSILSAARKVALTRLTEQATSLSKAPFAQQPDRLPAQAMYQFFSALCRDGERCGDDVPAILYAVRTRYFSAEGRESGPHGRERVYAYDGAQDKTPMLQPLFDLLDGYRCLYASKCNVTNLQMKVKEKPSELPVVFVTTLGVRADVIAEIATRGGQALPTQTLSQFRAEILDAYGSDKTATDLSELDPGKTVVIVPSLAKARGRPQDRYTYVLEPTRKALAAMQQAGYRILNESQWQDEVLATVFQTNVGPRTLRQLQQTRWVRVAWLPSRMLQRLSLSGGKVLVVLPEDKIPYADCFGYALEPQYLSGDQAMGSAKYCHFSQELRIDGKEPEQFFASKGQPTAAYLWISILPGGQFHRRSKAVQAIKDHLEGPVQDACFGSAQ